MNPQLAKAAELWQIRVWMSNASHHDPSERHTVVATAHARISGLDGNVSSGKDLDFLLQDPHTRLALRAKSLLFRRTLVGDSATVLNERGWFARNVSM